MSLSRVGIVQTTTGIDPAVEAVRLADAIGRLAADGATIVFTPEMSGRLDKDRKRLMASLMAESDDPVLAAVRAAAAQHGVWVHLGSLALDSGDGRVVNRGFVIDSGGGIVAHYDKIHLFDVDLPGGERYRESSTYAPGERAVVATSPLGGLGLTICYDLRFPNLHAALARAGARVIAVPAAFTRPTGRAHWEVLLRARAIETGCFVVAAAQTGEHEDGRATYGHSLVISPWGEVLLDMGEAAGEAVIEIDLALVDEARGRVPSLRHGRDWAMPVPLVETAAG
jgi:predicted amidohydrolase